MGSTKIEWAEKVWNPISGCTKVSPGCAHCYAERMAKRLAGRCGYPADDPFRVALHADKLDEPLRWKKPKRVFVCSMGDLFHEDVPKEYLDRVFSVAAVCRDHQFLVLTKRPQRMAAYFGRQMCELDILNAMHEWQGGLSGPLQWPIPNLWLGTSAENQAAADERIPHLLQTPAAVRFLSCEPLLGPVDFRKVPDFNRVNTDLSNWWVIVGGESGPKSRPMHPDWARAIRDQCQAAGVPFFYKQTGEWMVREDAANIVGDDAIASARSMQYTLRGNDFMHRVGKKDAGRLLDGREWNEMPKATERKG